MSAWTPPTGSLDGQGARVGVPLIDPTADILRTYLRENRLDRPEHFDRPLFQNRQGGRLSRSGVRYILEKYVEIVRKIHPGFTQPVSPHSFRHTKGMHLLQSGISLDVIRDFLGHADAKTTGVYRARKPRDEMQGAGEGRRTSPAFHDPILDAGRHAAGVAALALTAEVDLPLLTWAYPSAEFLCFDTVHGFSSDQCLNGSSAHNHFLPIIPQMCS